MATSPNKNTKITTTIIRNKHYLGRMEMSEECKNFACLSMTAVIRS